MIKSILLFGRSGSGKSTQGGVLAEHVFKTTKKRTRLYTGDRGGLDTIKPYEDLGIIEVVEMGDSDPWIFINRAVRGYIRDTKGKWVLDKEKNAEVGLWMFESMRSFAEAFMLDMSRKAAQGINIGGGANIAFTAMGDGETTKISGSNMAMYGIAQARMTEEIWESQKLPGQYLLWTSSVSKDEDPSASGKVLGPDVIGRALTADVPRWFHLTLRIDVLPAQGSKSERHILYLGPSVDVNAGNVASLGNTRLPLDAPPLKQIALEPANLAQAIQLLETGQDYAKEEIRKRLGLGSVT